MNYCRTCCSMHFLCVWNSAQSQLVPQPIRTQINFYCCRLPASQLPVLIIALFTWAGYLKDPVLRVLLKSFGKQVSWLFVRRRSIFLISHRCVCQIYWLVYSYENCDIADMFYLESWLLELTITMLVGYINADLFLVNTFLHYYLICFFSCLRYRVLIHSSAM